MMNDILLIKSLVKVSITPKVTVLFLVLLEKVTVFILN
jgi:hypothetical protein